MAMAQFVKPERGRPAQSAPRGYGVAKSSKQRQNTMQIIPTCFEEIQIPRLNLVESQFKGADRDIIICCKKCEAYPGGSAEVYKWLKMQDFEKWLKRPSYDGKGPTMQMVDMTCCISPMEFYLVWKNADYFLSKLLRRWMHTLIQDQDERFSEFTSPSEVMLGQYVAVFYHRDGRWYRAKALHRLGHKLLCVQLLDDGTKLEVGIERLRCLPPELHPPGCPPLAFRCQVAGLEVFSKSVQEKVVYAFVKAVRYVKHLKASVQNVNETSGVRSVTLWDLENTDNNINNIVIDVAKKYAARNDPELELVGKQMVRDIVMMIHMNYEIQIKDFDDFKLKGLRHWRITNVVNPYEFYMQYVHAANTYVNMQWHESMQNFYNDPIGRETYRVLTSRIYKRRHYVWWNKEEKIWERVRCLDSDLTTRTATVFSVDLGISQVVSYDDLWEIKRDFCGYSAKSFRASLIDVAPAGMADTWSKESIDAFKDMVMGKNKTFHGVIVSGAIVTDPVAGRGEETMDLAVILVEQNPEVTYTVQAALVVFGFAESTGLSSSRSDIFEHCGFGKKGHFDFEAFKAYQEANRSDEQQKDVIGAERLEMLHLNAINLSDDPPRLLGAYKSFSVATANNRSWSLPLEISTLLPQLKLVHIVSPGCMYVQRAASQENLVEMMAVMGEIVVNENSVNGNNIKVGDCVAVCQKIHQNGDLFWYRACVRQVVVSLEVAKLVLIDFGSEVIAKFDVIRLLPDFFRSIPGFAYRIHVEIPKLIPVGSITWSAACATNFPRYLQSWDDVDPGYFIWRPSSSSVIQVGAIHQQLVFNRTTGKWNMAPLLTPCPGTEEESPLTQFRDNVMLFNMFHSHGVGLDFEIKTPDTMGHGFGHLAELLVKMGFATYKTN